MKTAEAGFQILEHPADMGFRVWAANLPDLFCQAALAITAVLVDLSNVEAQEVTAFEILGDDLETLLYNWLSEILYYFDGEKRLFSQFSVVSHNSQDGLEFLRAEAVGEKYVPAKHQIQTYVKAVTFHQLSITHSVHGYEASVYLDI